MTGPRVKKPSMCQCLGDFGSKVFLSDAAFSLKYGVKVDGISIPFWVSHPPLTDILDSCATCVHPRGTSWLLFPQCFAPRARSGVPAPDASQD